MVSEICRVWGGPLRIQEKIDLLQQEVEVDINRELLDAGNSWMDDGKPKIFALLS